MKKSMVNKLLLMLFVITFFTSALGVFSSKKGVLKLIKFPIALMPSVQRGPIDFSGDGLVGNSKKLMNRF